MRNERSVNCDRSAVTLCGLGLDAGLHTGSKTPRIFSFSAVPSVYLRPLRVIVSINTSAVLWHSVTQRRKAVSFSEILVDSNKPSWSHVPEERNLHQRRYGYPISLVNRMFAGRQPK